ncbi:MAG: guanylate kinase [Dehalococcoidia bacterium]|nr:guanylate kinase [Dehalococcoidia bacterium]
MSCNHTAQITPVAGPLLIIVSGPSGVGKDAILSLMKEKGYPFEFITTVTTRPKRVNERDGVHYHFVSAEKFQAMLKQSGLLEWANVYGNWYGVPKQPVKEALAAGRDTIIKVDMQGAATIKKIVPEAVFIFIAPPSIEELLNRLKQRSTESQFDLEVRTRAAEGEMKQVFMFDYIVVNKGDGIDEAIAQIQAIVTAEKCRVNPRRITL